MSNIPLVIGYVGGVVEKNTKKAFVYSVVFTLGTAVTFIALGLIALLAIVAGKGNLLWGILLMFLYSIGHSALVIIAGTSISFVKKISNNEKYNKLGTALKFVMGFVILLIGLYMFWLAF